jgi:hypothetical protein
MAADDIAARELHALQDEVSAAERERQAAQPSPTTPSFGSGEASEDGQHELWDQLRDLISEITNSFEEAEKTISTHPTQSIVGALLVGILIGRLLGRR